MKQDIAIVRGTTNTLAISLTDANGNPYNLKEGDVLVFAVKKRPYDNDHCIKKTATECTDGVCKIYLTPTNTDWLEPGKYFYDVSLWTKESYQLGGTLINDFYNIVEMSTFEIKPNISKESDAE